MKKMEKKERQIRIILAIFGIILVGVGVAFNASASLGNDPVGIVYDGIRSALNLSSKQLGMASNIVNITLVVIVFFLKRHYVNIGTFIYIIPYGFVVDFGGKMYHMLLKAQTLPIQITGAAIGCFMLYMGVAMYITADVGLDPFTGLVMAIKDKLNMQFRVVKVFFDICCIVIGFILGGKLGIITILTALVAGPVIQFLSEIVQKQMEHSGLINKEITKER